MMARWKPRHFSLLAGSFAGFATLLFMTFAPSLRAATENAPIKIVAFGDSLTAGYMLKPSEAFPAQLQMALQAKGHKVEVVNAGVSGDTTAAGLERLEWTLQSGADAVILELGANDALRGVQPRTAYNNLDRMLKIIKDKGADVLIAGMRAPGNWGPEYAAEFNTMYQQLANMHDAALYPFFLEGVAVWKDDGLDTRYIQEDGLHPTAAGVAEIVKRILPDVETLIARVNARKTEAPKN